MTAELETIRRLAGVRLEIDTESCSQACSCRSLKFSKDKFSPDMFNMGHSESEVVKAGLHLVNDVTGCYVTEMHQEYTPGVSIKCCKPPATSVLVWNILKYTMGMRTDSIRPCD